MFLSLQICLSFACAAIACEMHERISGRNSLSVMIVYRYLSFLIVSGACPFIVMSFVAPSVLLRRFWFSLHLSPHQDKTGQQFPTFLFCPVSGVLLGPGQV